MPCLRRPGGRRDRAVDVQVGDRAEQVPAAAGPQLRADRVDRLHQGRARRRRRSGGRSPRRWSGPGSGPRPGRSCTRCRGAAVRCPPAGCRRRHVVGQVQHVIGLVVRQVHLQQIQVGVDRLGQPEPGHQPVHRGDPAETGRVHVAADLVAAPFPWSASAPAARSQCPAWRCRAATRRRRRAAFRRLCSCAIFFTTKAFPRRAALRPQTHAR